MLLSTSAYVRDNITSLPQKGILNNSETSGGGRINSLLSITANASPWCSSPRPSPNFDPRRCQTSTIWQSSFLRRSSCYFHQRYGSAARNCEAPCTVPSENWPSDRSFDKRFLNLETRDNCSAHSDDQRFYQNRLTSYDSSDNRSLCPRTNKSQPRSDAAKSDSEDIPENAADSFISRFTVPDSDAVTQDAPTLSMTQEKDSCDGLVSEFRKFFRVSGAEEATTRGETSVAPIRGSHLVVSPYASSKVCRWKVR